MTSVQGASTGAKSREVRLGIVMYGGVSLAIYIYGVAHELFRAVRGRGIYKLLKAVTDSDIVVDVISGTSAGGINGVLLGYALCNEREFGDAAPLWREHGDLGGLLRSPQTPIEACTSVLESEPNYQSKIEQGLRKMQPLRAAGDDPSRISELDLFVTGTDVDGVVQTVFDDAGHPIDVKDHRAVFLLKHREGRRHPFSASAAPGAGEHVIPALAKLSRLTSCFPVAFAPVKVVKNAAGHGPDALLSEWGGLTYRADGTDQPATYFLDGGVLDNKPFTYTTGAIFSRAADVEVDRTLFYVEPDPETFAPRNGTGPDASGRGRQAPNVVEAAVAALVTIPGYESISDDLKLVGHRNNKIAQYNRVVSQLQSEGLPRWSDLADETLRLHVRARLVGLTERVIEGVLNRDGVRHLMTAEEKDVAGRLIRQFDAMVSTLMGTPAGAPAAPAMDPETVLEDFDVYFRQRRLYRVVYRIHELRRDPALDGERAAQYAAVLTAANAMLQLYEVVRWAMEGLVDRAPFEWDDAIRTWGAVSDALAQLLDDRSPAAAAIPQHFDPRGEWLSASRLTAVYQGLKAARTQITGAVGRGERVGPGEGGTSLLRRLDRLEDEIVALIPERSDPVRIAHATFRSLDALVYPLQLMSGVMEKDIIKTVRISPADARRGFSQRPAADKISGDTLHHFGGFLKASWRSNDILWGRLDGLCQLVETVVTPARLERVGQHKPLAQDIRDRLAADLDPAVLFPKSGPAVQQDLSMWLRRLFDGNLLVQAEARAELPGKLDILIEAAQLEIIEESLGDVIDDSLKEQGRWNAFKVDADRAGAGPRYDARHWRFASWAGHADPLVSAVGAAITARGAVESLAVPGESPGRPAGTGVGRFFANDYRVGSEGVAADVPPLVLLETGLKAGLVLRKCLLNSLNDKGAARGIISRASGAVFQVLHAVTVVARRAPEQGRAARWAIMAAALTLLVVGITQGLVKGVMGWTVFVAVPLLVIGGAMLVGYLTRKQQEPRLDPLRPPESASA
jgi:patatin-related protein